MFDFIALQLNFDAYSSIISTREDFLCIVKSICVCRYYISVLKEKES